MSANDSYEVGYTTPEGSDVDQDVLYIGLDVPPSRRVFIASRELLLTENSYTVELMTAANGFTGGVDGYKSALDEGNVESVGSVVKFDCTPDGAETVNSSQIVETGTAPGSAKTPTQNAPDDLLRSWTSSPMLKITRAAGGQPYRLSLQAIIYERSDNG